MDSNQAYFVKMIGRGVQEEVVGKEGCGLHLLIFKGYKRTQLKIYD